MEKKGAGLPESRLLPLGWGPRSRGVPWVLCLVALLTCVFLPRPDAFAQIWRDEYRQALRYIQNKQWSQAVEALTVAIKGNAKDDPGINIYGMRFGYYPHRDLGIAYYHLGKADLDLKGLRLARDELNFSIQQASTGRAREFLIKVKAAIRTARKREFPAREGPRLATFELSGLPRGGKLILDAEAPRPLYSNSLSLKQLKPEKEHTIQVRHPDFLPYTHKFTLAEGEKGKFKVSLERDKLADPPRRGRRKPDAVAVVIGNRNYRRGVPRVDYAHRDARAVREHLIRTLGYREGNIVFKQDATKGDFQAIFGDKENPRGELYKLVQGKSDVFIYYSGHGAPDFEAMDRGERAQGYFVPVDANPNLISRGGYSQDLLNNNLKVLLNEKRPRSLTVVVDACFTGLSDAGSIRGGKESPLGIEVKNPLLLGRNVAVYYATQRAETASWYEKQQHGLLTYFFLLGLRGAADTTKDAKITHKEMQEYLKENVSYEARRLDRKQTPSFQGKAEVLLD